jgi:hypothetical protein
MGIIEQIQQMKQQGTDERQIIQSLQEQGISPRQINDALNQAQVKSAVSGGYDMDEQNVQENMQPQLMEQQYMPSTYEQQNYNNYPQGDQNNNYNEIPSPNSQYAPQQFTPQDYPSQENYGSGGYDYSQPTYSDTMIEIAEQAISQKTQKMQKQLTEMNEFSLLTKTKLEDMNNRLKRIETTIDKLQLAILDKVGSYADNLQGIKKEMSMMQDSFSKVVNQAIDHSKKTHKK